MKDQTSDTRGGKFPPTLTRVEIFFLLSVAAFLFLQIFLLPFTPVFVEGDQMLPVTNAMRLLDGEVMYRDFFHLSPPGAEYWYAALFYIFGAKVWVLNATILLLALAQLALIFAFSKRLLDGVFVFLPTLLYFIIGFRPYGIDGSFRLFSVIFVLAAALVMMLRRTPAFLLLAGALCGAAAFFVQTRGVLGIGAIGLFFLWVYFKEEKDFRLLLRRWAYLSLAFLAVVFVTQFYPAYLAGFDNYYFANVTFIKDHYGADTLSNTFAYFTDLPSLNSYIQNYGTGGGIFRYIRVALPSLFTYAIVPLVYLIYLLYRKLRRVEGKNDNDLMMLSILGVVLFLGASAPTAHRLYHISIPAVVVLVWLLSRSFTQRFALASVAALSLLGFAYAVQRQTVSNVQLDLPAGRVAFLSATMAEKYQWLMTQTEPGDLIFEAQHPTFYFPLHLKNPTPFYLVRDNNYTPDFQVKQLMAALETRPPRFIIWHGGWSKELAERKPGDNLDPLWQFIRTNYELKKELREFGEYTTNSERDIEFWERRK